MKKVLLARPNPFIVKNMKAFVSEMGFEPFPIVRLNDIQAFDSQSVAGIVISTAVNSSVQESYMDVIQFVRKSIPDKPIALATLVDPVKLKTTIQNELSLASLDEDVVTLEEINTNLPKSKKSIVIISKEDISNPESISESKKTISDLFK